jgi:hypothetical protein
MIHKTIQGIAAVAAILVLSTAFGRGSVPVINVVGAPIPQGPATTMESIEKAMVRAGGTLGWQMTPKGPGRMEGVINVRNKHHATVGITYDMKAYNITYLSSVNLNYSEADKTIHPNYNSWVMNLDKAIQAQARAL